MLRIDKTIGRLDNRFCNALQVFIDGLIIGL